MWCFVEDPFQTMDDVYKLFVCFSFSVQYHAFIPLKKVSHWRFWKERIRGKKDCLFLAELEPALSSFSRYQRLHLFIASWDAAVIFFTCPQGIARRKAKIWEWKSSQTARKKRKVGPKDALLENGWVVKEGGRSAADRKTQFIIPLLRPCPASVRRALNV